MIQAKILQGRLASWSTIGLLACLLHGFASLSVRASEVELLDNSTVCENALTFARGPAARFGHTVNGRTHQQTPLVTYRGYQYVTFVDASRCVCIGRRKLPTGQWQVIQFADHRFQTNDSHNTSVIGICDKDGTIHMAFDHHASPLNYRVSKQGAAHDPDSVTWNADLFGEVQHSLGSVQTDVRVTYPRFISSPNGNLMLYYRAVTSGNGDGMIEEYNGDTHAWTPELGKFISRDIGTYTFAGNTSDYRCPYVNSVSYAGNRLHVSWVWRDRFERTSVVNQHDLCYAYSDDHGRTWHNSAGKVIGKTGVEFIHLDTPGLVVAPIDSRSGLTNQNTHYAYCDGRVHVVMQHRDGETGTKRYHHYWRSSEGVWDHQVLPFAGGRPKLVGTDEHSFVLVYRDDDVDGHGQRLCLAEAHPNADQTGWIWEKVALPQHDSVLGEPVLDLDRWEDTQVLSVYLQEEPAGMVSTRHPEPIDGKPSPLKVVDYRMSGMTGHVVVSHVAKQPEADPEHTPVETREVSEPAVEIARTTMPMKAANE
ncbi:BNR repeat-containing family member [Neorhodopirellula lusitana]|uniref:BNR repeat-containing family member n=1 Tax=Neorhodopirellula lusitana TaxID=445327 RepID=A0ABY1QSX3_9BACT|nr:BNR repeat-containing protein [Neorhodopirellula lusitana]SMP78283.1 BNR repeat-containing family member [Neorhodopirellula lusitana]